MIKATPQVVIAEARQLLEKSEPQAARSLKISDEFLKEDEWLHLLVSPVAEGLSALDYVDAIELIETALRKKFGEEILIAPAKS